MRPIETETIASAAQSAGSNLPTWASVLLTILGGFIAAASGIGVAEYRVWREKRKQRRWIASTLLADVRRIEPFFENFSDDTWGVIREAILKIAYAKPPEYLQLYPRNGFYLTNYADVANLGPEIAHEIASLYCNLEKIEAFLKIIRDRDPDTNLLLNFGTAKGGIHDQIVDARRQVGVITWLLKEIVPSQST